MRLPQMTTRRWMIAVAVVGLVMGGFRLKQRYDDFSSQSRWNVEREADWREREQRSLMAIHRVKVFINRLEQEERNRRPDDYAERLGEVLARRQELAAAERRRRNYHAAMARKYRHAARYPWLPVEPDPPEAQ